MKRYSLEIGDAFFPLEVNLENVSRQHLHVGKSALVAEHANESLHDLRGKKVKITGVFEKHGQIAGYEVQHSEKTYYGAKKDFYVVRQFLEDVHLNSGKAQHLREILSHWEGQRDYYGTDWDGVELFHFELAKAVDLLAVESPGWYKYPSSLREDMDGKDWRLVVPDRNGAICVNCHSLVHDYVWSLSTTIYSTRQVDLDQLKLVGHPDHWVRTLSWTWEVARALRKEGVYDYEEVLEDLKTRIRLSLMLKRLSYRLLPEISAAYGKLFGTPPKVGKFSVGVSRIRLGGTSIGRHEPPSDETGYSILSVGPRAFRSKDYLLSVLKHELIHLVLKTARTEGVHNKEFHLMGELVGLDRRYQD